MIEVRQLENGEEKAWDDYVYRCAESSHCHLSGWRRVDRAQLWPSILLSLGTGEWSGKRDPPTHCDAEFFLPAFIGLYAFP